MGKICKICGLVAKLVANITDFATESYDVPDLTHTNPVKYFNIKECEQNTSGNKACRDMDNLASTLENNAALTTYKSFSRTAQGNTVVNGTNAILLNLKYRGDRGAMRFAHSSDEGNPGRQPHFWHPVRAEGKDARNNEMRNIK